MFKFGTIGAFKQVRNNPRYIAAVDLVNGLVVIPNDATEVQALPADVAAAKLGEWVVGNIIDKPEIRNKVDFKVEAGEFVRAFYLPDLKELPVEIDASVVETAYASVAVGDVLVPNAVNGKWVKADGTTIDADDYAVGLKVLEKSTFGGQGLYCKVQA